MHQKRYLVEIAISIIAMILGTWISILVWLEGYYLGALMLVVTGMITVVLGIKEYTGKKGPLLQESFLKILRRTMLFLNLMLSVVVAGTLVSML